MGPWDVEGLLERLAPQAWALPLRGEDVEVLDSPDDFFKELLEGLATAQRRITIASLYFGTGGGREADFADALAAAAGDASRPHLRVRLLLDALRCTRPTRAARVAASTEPAAVTSTAEMLATRLLEGQAPPAPPNSQPRVEVALFHTPALRGLLKRVLPPRVCEVVGVMHVKAYCFDDTVILSGANISSTYLSTRQDRYLAVRGAPQLAALLADLVDGVSRFSYRLLPVPPEDQQEQGGGQEAAATSSSGSGSGGRLPSGRRLDALRGLAQRQTVPWQRGAETGAARTESAAQPGLPAPSVPRWQRIKAPLSQRYRLGPCPAGLDPVRQAGLFAAALRHHLLQLLVPRPGWQQVVDFAVLAQEDEAAAAAAQPHPHAAAAPASAEPPLADLRVASFARDTPAVAAGAAAAAAAAAADTWIVPLVQAGFAGVRQEERGTLALLAWATQAGDAGKGRHCSHGSGAGGACALLQLASPYLNLARPYEALLARQANGAALELITASPQANGFFGSAGASRYIPLAYSLLEHRTWRRLTVAQRRGSAGGGAAAAWRTRQLAWRQRLADGGWLSRGGGNSVAAAAAAHDGGGGTPARGLWEYCRSGWEFHAKGIWVYPPAGVGGSSAADGSSWAPPLGTSIGSSNFGFRSLHRDLELQFILVTRNPDLRAALAREAAALKAHSQAVAEAALAAPGRRGGPVARLAVRLLRGFL